MAVSLPACIFGMIRNSNIKKLPKLNLWFFQRHRDRYRARPVVLIAGRHTNSGGKDTCCRVMAQGAPAAGCMILFNNLEVILL